MVGALLLALGALVASDSSAGTAAHGASTPAVAPAPWFGALQASPSQMTALTSVGLKTVTLELGWDAFEPQQGKADPQYVARQRHLLAQWKTAGFRVVLDTGLQYPPAWAFSLPGASRLVNQYGQTWSGQVGSDIVDAVFNPQVQAAQRSYYELLAATFPPGSFEAVRVGGLNMGEMSYPVAAAGAPATMWMYDAAAQANAPVPGWIPGTGTQADARASVDYYLSSLKNYAAQLLAVTARNFPEATLQLLLPSWGLRPGQLDDALAGGLSGTSPAEINGFLTQGLDWASQVRLLVPYGSRGVAYTTWLDAPSHGSSLQDMSPAEYLHTLTVPLGLGLAGENTGQGTPASMALCLQRVRTLGMQGLMWMTATEMLASPSLMQSLAGASGTVFLISAESR